MSGYLTDAHLPGIWKDADEASGRGQRWTLALSIAKVGGGVTAALGGVLTWQVGRFDLAASVILLGFLAALVCEFASWIYQPERMWYEGRAVAESAKTLAWRYAVGADPFPVVMTRDDAENLFRERMSSVLDEVSDRLVFSPAYPLITPRMDELRQGSFPDRREAYVNGRTLEQQDWYARKARVNRRNANTWRLLLIVAEMIAVLLAVARIFGGWQMDLAGLLAATIAAGAAWVAVKQFTPLASAYTVAANELAVQADNLPSVTKERWSLVAADAEEAISREHTTWLASRTGRPAQR